MYRINRKNGAGKSTLVDILSKFIPYENGFIHSKMCLIDDEIVSVGTANMDFRSFELNFEVNAFVYDENLAKDLRAAYEHDITKSNNLLKNLMLIDHCLLSLKNR